MDVITRWEFELAYFEAAVQYLAIILRRSKEKYRITEKEKEKEEEKYRKKTKKERERGREREKEKGIER